MTPEDPVDPEIRRLSVRGLQVTYTDDGRGEPVLVLIPGVPGSVRDFRWLAAALQAVAPEARIVRINLPGFGGTDERLGGDMSVSVRAMFVTEVLEELGLERFLLCGHSMGGAVAIAVAAHDPERVSRLALLSSVGATPHRAYRSIPMPRLTARVFCSRPGRRFLSTPLRRAFVGMGFPSSTPTEELHATVRVMGALRWPEVRGNVDLLAKVRLPVQVFIAADDPLVERPIAQELAAALKGDLHLFADGGHNIQKTRAIEIADILA